ncbi:Sas10 C-terminal domain-containing protein [Elsinoe australis]|uniref:Sas10 C-terminal domain-containing protein n=1 Tax=Elsinoe australis TaxID=40998 RepID=A0A4U7AW34_9PEZI|nr:Sas10 C-terminal domain-containing protein [Elsinoe australis]
MAKKRKAPGSSKSKAAPDEDFNKRVRLNVDSYEDVAGSDDEFQIGRDKVLLDEAPADKRARKLRENEQFLEASDEEVLGYSDEDDEEDFNEDENDEERPVKNGNQRGAVRSDEEDGEAADEEDELNEWGDSKQDYYGADQMETEQDALDEEAEAKRLQQKQLEALTAADYGFDEDEWTGETKKDTEKAGKKSQTVTEALPQLKVTDDMGPAERLKLLKSRYPEFEPLSKEFLELREEMAGIQKELKQGKSKVSRDGQGYNDGPASVLETKERAASAYLATLAMYFALLTSSTSPNGTIAISATAIREHPVMESLLSVRSLWHQVKDLPEDESEWESDEEETAAAAPATSTVTAAPRRRDRGRKTRAEKAALAVQRAEEARRAERMAAAEADLTDLDDLLARKPRKAAKAAAKTNGTNNDDSDFGEEELSEKALADKAAKRKSLRFYTSQIAQKSNKRGAAGRSAGGDDDIPYRERLRDRQARLMAEAAKKGRRDNPGADMGGESGSEDEAQAKAIREDAEDGEGDYYQFISGKKKARKEEKELLAAAKKEAILNGGRVVEQEVVGEDGKRKISYAIEKNKGLTPHRKKENRNPRVKKRKKFDEKKKKLASMKPTYKGGEGRGGYGGELSGIKSNLVKSRKL